MSPLPWTEFKAFIWKNLGDSRAFWITSGAGLKRLSNQVEEVQDWVSHLEHLHITLIELNADGAPEETDLIRFFREGLKPLAKAQMELDSWDKLIEKTIDTKVKASPQPVSILREMNNCCPRDPGF